MKSYWRLLVLLIGKNLKVLTRSKISASMIILGPIFLVLLLGLSFNNSGIFGIQAGVYAENYNEDINSFIAKLEAKEFSVMKTGSIDECKNSLKEGRIHLCVSLPQDFDVTGNIQKQITLFVDYSRINLAFLVLDIVDSQVEAQSSSLSKGITEGLLTKIDSTQTELGTQSIAITETLKDVDGIFRDLDTASKEAAKIETEFDLGTEDITFIEDEVNFLIENYSVESDDARDLVDRIEALDDKLNNLSQDLSVIAGAKSTIESRIGNVRDKNTVVKDNYNLVQASLDNLVVVLNDNPVSDANTIVNPLKTEIVPLSADKTNLDYLAPTLIVLVIMFMAIFLSATIVVSNHSSKAFFRTKVSITHESANFIANYLTVFLILFLQLLFLIGISQIFWNVNLFEHFGPVFLIIFLLMSFFICLGIFIGYAPHKHETAILLSILVSSILLLFSNLVFPLESMPEFMQQIASLNPFVIGTESLNKALLFGVLAGKQILAIVIYLVIIIPLIILIHFLRDRKLNK